MFEDQQKLVFILLAGLVGWVFNLFKAVGLMGELSNSMYWIRMVGIIIAPIGAVMGYIPS